MELKELLASVPQEGTLRFIGLRPARREPVRVVERAELVTGLGLDGDRFRRKGGNRQVSLIQAEHLPVIAGLIGWETVPAEVLRRNLVISGIPVRPLMRLRFRIGDALLEGTGECPPCSRMEEALGLGGYAAMQGMGGIVARVLEGAPVRVGDPVRAIGLPPDDA